MSVLIQAGKPGGRCLTSPPLSVLTTFPSTSLTQVCDQLLIPIPKTGFHLRDFPVVCNSGQGSEPWCGFQRPTSRLRSGRSWGPGSLSHGNTSKCQEQSQEMDWISSILLKQVSVCTHLAVIKITADSDYSHEIKMLSPWKESYDKSRSDQIRSAAQSCPTLCNPMNRSTPGLPVHHQLPAYKL